MQVQKINNNNQQTFGNKMMNKLARAKYIPLTKKPMVSALQTETELISKPSGNNIFHLVIDNNNAKIVQLERSIKNGLTEHVLFSAPVVETEKLFKDFYNYCKFTLLKK